MKKNLILLVDDERDFVNTLAERMAIRGLETRVAYDGESALQMIQDETFAAMVLDLRMPGIDGLEVLREVGRTHPQISVIVLTGHGSEKDREKCESLGAFAYLNKPVNIKDLASLLKKAQEAGGK